MFLLVGLLSSNGYKPKNIFKHHAANTNLSESKSDRLHGFISLNSCLLREAAESQWIRQKRWPHLLLKHSAVWAPMCLNNSWMPPSPTLPFYFQKDTFWNWGHSFNAVDHAPLLHPTSCTHMVTPAGMHSLASAFLLKITTGCSFAPSAHGEMTF